MSVNLNVSAEYNPSSLQTQTGSWRAVAAWLLNAGILWIAPWFTALFFSPASSIATTIVSLVCMVLISYRRIEVSVTKPETWALVFALYTAVTNLWAANLAASLQQTAGEISAILLFMITMRYAHYVSQWMGTAISFLGIALYVYGMGAGFGWWTAIDAVYDHHQLASVFEYHNTFGALELAIAVLSFITITNTTRIAKDTGARLTKWLSGWWMSIPGILALMIAINAIVASSSRVVFVLTPIVLIVMLVGKYVIEKSTWAIISGIITIALAGGTSFLALQSLDAKHPDTKYYLVSLLLNVGLSVLMSWLNQYMAQKSISKRQLLIGTGILVIALLGVIYKLRSHFTTSAGSITSRISTISFKSVSLQERFTYYKDAIHMWTNAPLLGSGGGTWVTKYQAFQSLPYTSNQVHSTIFDQLLNGGIIGLALYLGLLVVSFWVILRYLRNGQDKRIVMMVFGFGLGAAVLWLHSLLDFDFAFGYYQFIFWSWLAIAVGMAAANLGPIIATPKQMTSTQQKQLARQRIAWGRGGIVTTVVLGAFAVLFGLSFSASQFFVQQVTLPVNAQNPGAQYSLYQSASAWTPYDPSVQIGLANYYFTTAVSSKQNSLFSQAYQYALSAANSAPWNGSIQSQASIIAYQLGNDVQAVAWSQKAYQDFRFNQQILRNLLGISMWSAAKEMKANPTAAKAGLQAVLRQYQQYHNSEHDVNNTLFPDVTPLTEDASMQVYIATAYMLLKQYSASEQAITPFLTANRDQAAVILYMIDSVIDDAGLHKLTKVDQAYLSQIKGNPQALSEYNFLKSL